MAKRSPGAPVFFEGGERLSETALGEKAQQPLAVGEHRVRAPTVHAKGAPVVQPDGDHPPVAHVQLHAPVAEAHAVKRLHGQHDPKLFQELLRILAAELERHALPERHAIGNPALDDPCSGRRRVARLDGVGLPAPHSSEDTSRSADVPVTVNRGRAVPRCSDNLMQLMCN